MNLRKAAIQVPCQMAYDDVWHWENGLIKVSKEGLWGFIDERGNVVIPVEDDSLSTWPFPGFFSDLPSVCSCRTETARNNEFSALASPSGPFPGTEGDVALPKALSRRGKRHSRRCVRSRQARQYGQADRPGQCCRSRKQAASCAPLLFRNSYTSHSIPQNTRNRKQQRKNSCEKHKNASKTKIE